MTYEQIFALYLVFALLASIFIAPPLGRLIRGQTKPIPDPMPGEKRPLTEYRVREGLTQILQLNRIVGDADIRAGEVHPAADPEKAPIFSRMLMGAYVQAKSCGMTSGSNVYFAVKNPGEGTGWTYHCFGDFGIGDAAAVANLLDRQAAMISELRKELIEIKEIR